MLTSTTSQIIMVLAAQLEEIQSRMQQTQSELVALRSAGGAVDEARCHDLENQTTVLLNQYVTVQRLHAATDFSHLLTGVFEVLETLVGVDQFSMYMGSTLGQRLYSIIQHPAGHYDEFVEPSLGQVGEKLGTETFFERPGRISIADGSFPIAVIPLRCENAVVGAIAVYKLFEQKGGFNQVDIEIFKIFSRFIGPLALGAIADVKRKYELSTMEEVSEYARRVQASDF